MFKVSVKAVLCNFVTSYVSGSFLLMMCLHLWPVLLTVVGWIIVIRFLEIFSSSININDSASKIVQLELYLNTIRYTSIITVLKKLHWASC